MLAKLRRTFHPREFLYPSNVLTLVRLLLLPVALRAMHQPNGQRRALATLGAAMFTDLIDGPIARQRDEVSQLGKVLDPIADKLMIDCTAITLSRTRSFPWWITILLVGRDVAILIGGLLIYRRRSTVSMAVPSGKLTTVSLTAAMLLYLADGPRSGRPALYAALVPFIGSMAAYLRHFLRSMSHEL